MKGKYRVPERKLCSSLAIFGGLLAILGLLAACASPPVSEPATPTVAPFNTLAPDPANVTIPGTITAPYPTLNNISIEWFIEGDANLDGVVSMRFRKAGESEWREGMSLRRVPARSNEDAGFSWHNKHSGSVFDLDPDTTYEIELTLSDPDGGSATQTLTVVTRPVPAPMAGAPVKHVTPETFGAIADTAQPGDILELGSGAYDSFIFNRDGEPGQPIVIRSMGEAIIIGVVNLDRRRHIILDGLIINGSIHFHDSESIAVTHSRVITEHSGIVFQGHSQNAYIADNVIVGPTVWQESALGVDGDNLGEGIQFSGHGHVIQNNTVIGFRDNISLMEGSEAIEQFSIDILNNDIYEAADDGVEADYCFNNCRIMRNRLTNVFMGLSSQPSLGGPTYFIRNVMYNVVYSPFKLHNGSVGDVVMHNSIAKSGDAIGVYTGDYFLRSYFRNNIFLGGSGGYYNGYNNGKGLIASLDAAGDGHDLDYDAFGTRSDRFFGQIGTRLFTSLDELRNKTTEQHAIQIDWDIFTEPAAYPAEPFPALPPADLRIKEGSSVQDAALLIPNINDQFNDAAPDIGAYEVGQALPIYGPRVEPPKMTAPAIAPTSTPIAVPSPTPLSALPADDSKDMVADFKAPLTFTDGMQFGACNLLTLEIAGTPLLNTLETDSLKVESPANSDGFIIRTTDALPPFYRIRVDIGEVNFDVSNSDKDENGMYFIVISDEPGEPQSNSWWHTHRKVVMDTDNNVWRSGGEHPIFFGYYLLNDSLRFYNKQSAKWSPDWRAAANYQQGGWYTFELEKTETYYILRVYDHASQTFLAQSNIPIDQVKGGSTTPDYLAIGDPHTNYYTGSALIDNLRISGTSCGG